MNPDACVGATAEEQRNELAAGDGATALIGICAAGGLGAAAVLEAVG